MIHHQWPLDVTNVTSIGFFVGETPTYKLSSTFKVDLCTLIEKKTKIHRRNIPMFQVALVTVVRARTERPDGKNLVREACNAFELQVPVDQRRSMEKLIDKVFLGSTAKDLKFIYYKERHVHIDVFYRAIQMQRCHKESYSVVAVEGIHPDEHFVFEMKLRKQVGQRLIYLTGSYLCIIVPTGRSWWSTFTMKGWGNWDLLTAMVWLCQST
jgi:hypothetical protein